MGLEYDFVKVLDFGLVKVRDHAAAGETLLTMDHTTTGTPAYRRRRSSWVRRTSTAAPTFTRLAA